MFAGMRWGRPGSVADPASDGRTATDGGKLVCWSSNVPSRRADELARNRQPDSDSAEQQLSGSGVPNPAARRPCAACRRPFR